MRRWSSLLSFLFFIFFFSFIYLLRFLFFIFYFLSPTLLFFTSKLFFYIYMPRTFLISYMIVSVIVCMCERVYLCFVCYFSNINAYCCSARFLFYFLFYFLLFLFYFLLFFSSPFLLAKGRPKLLKWGGLWQCWRWLS